MFIPAPRSLVIISTLAVLGPIVQIIPVFRWLTGSSSISRLASHPMRLVPLNGRFSLALRWRDSFDCSESV